MLQRPEFTGGIALRGLANLEEFVRAGGTLIALDSATELPLQFLPIGARGLLRATGGRGDRRRLLLPGIVSADRSG